MQLKRIEISGNQAVGDAGFAAEVEATGRQMASEADQVSSVFELFPGAVSIVREFFQTLSEAMLDLAFVGRQRLRVIADSSHRRRDGRNQAGVDVGERGAPIEDGLPRIIGKRLGQGGTLGESQIDVSQKGEREGFTVTGVGVVVRMNDPIVFDQDW